MGSVNINTIELDFENMYKAYCSTARAHNNRMIGYELPIVNFFEFKTRIQIQMEQQAQFQIVKDLINNK